VHRDVGVSVVILIDQLNLRQLRWNPP